MRSGGGLPAFNPLSLSPSLWLDTADMTTLFQDSAGTTPVANAADPVGRISDKSGGGRHVVQATGTMRPAFRQTGGKNAIEGDGVDDGLATATGTGWGTGRDVFLVISNPSDDTNFVMLGSSIDSGFLGASTSGSAAASDDGSGTQPFVNNALSATRGSNYSATAGGATKLVEWRNANLTNHFGLLLGQYAGFQFSGRYHEVIICPTQTDTVRGQVRDYLTAKWGVA